MDISQHLQEHHGFIHDGMPEPWMLAYHERMHEDMTAYNLPHTHIGSWDGEVHMLSSREMSMQRHPQQRASGNPPRPLERPG